MALFLFLLAIDWIMKETTRERQNGIQWNLGEQLNDLEFADGISLVSSNNQQMQDKTAWLTAYSIKLGLRLHCECEQDKHTETQLYPQTPVIPSLRK